MNMQPELFDDNQIGYGVNVRLPLDINGHITAGVDAADKQLSAARAREEDARLQLLHSAAGIERLSPMAVVAIGGLIAGTFLTLLVVPVLFHLLESGRQRFNQ